MELRCGASVQFNGVFAAATAPQKLLAQLRHLGSSDPVAARTYDRIQ